MDRSECSYRLERGNVSCWRGHSFRGECCGVTGERMSRFVTGEWRSDGRGMVVGVVG